MRWALLPYRRYFEFRGRSRRTEYWTFALGWLITSFVLGSIEGLLGLAGVPVAQAITWLFVLGSFIPGLAVTVRRLHDVNRTGWWAALPLTPFLLAFSFALFNEELLDSMTLAIGAAMLLCPTALLAVLAWKGTAGRNRFGEDPRHPDADLEAVFS